MRELGMMNLMVTALDPGTDATSNGSSLIRRTMSPNACRQFDQAGISHLANSIKCSKHVQYPFWVARNGLRNGDTGS